MTGKMPYTAEKAQIILDAIVEGRSLRSICAERDDLPAASTFLLWVKERPELAEQYARAMQV
ncbi:MAG: hypothetical protein ACRC0L_08930, partial [Angustibacter sp.]